MKKTSRSSPKKQQAKQAISGALALANANQGKLKSVKIKIKFGGKSGKKSTKRTRPPRGGY